MSELYIETHGNGDTRVVLVHGWAMHGGVFARGTPDPLRHPTAHGRDQA